MSENVVISLLPDGPEDNHECLHEEWGLKLLLFES